MEDSSECIEDRERYIEGLAAQFGQDRRGQLESLPLEELRYLTYRSDLWPSYRDRRMGAWLLTWESSAVYRGHVALSEVEASADWNCAGARTLDVGCGAGGFLIAAARRGARAYGIDSERYNVMGAYLRARSWNAPIAATVASAMALPYRAESFDAVTCGDVIEHLPEPETALREIRRVLRPGGFFWLSAPKRFSPANLWRDPHHHYFGVSVLPPGLAIWYLVRLRRALPRPERYGVERLPTYGRTLATLRRLGFELRAGEYRPLVALRDPSQVVKPWKRRMLKGCLAIGLRIPLRALFGFMAELNGSIRVVCRKPND